MDANQYYVRDSPSCVMAKVGKCADPSNLPWPRDRSAAQPGQHGDRALLPTTEYTRYIIRLWHNIDGEHEHDISIDAVQIQDTGYRIQNSYRIE